ncbi:MAG TPA: glycosyl transferase family 2, partial [Terracidiphilus sp.]
MRLIELAAFLQHTAANAGLWLYTQRGIGHYLRTHYGNDPVNNPFRYLYQWNAFDTTLLIPYFVVMILLAFYGMHRYQLVYLYYKHRDRAVSDPPSHFAELPRITVQLPIFNEQYVIDR